MFDFKNNDYEIKETGKDFWGRKKFEITEKPKSGCGGMLVVLILCLLGLIFADSQESETIVNQSNLTDSISLSDETIKLYNSNDQAIDVEVDQANSNREVDENIYIEEIIKSDEYLKPDSDQKLETVEDKINRLRKNGNNDRQIRKILNLTRKEWKKINK